MESRNNKILFVLHLPPPVHGAAMMGKYLRDSKEINESFDCHFINLSASTRVDEVGKMSFRKVVFMFTNLWQIIRTVIKEKPNVCYLTPTSNMGAAFLRDFILIKSLGMFRINIVLHFHNKASTASIKNRLYNFLCKAFFKGVKVILLGEELYAEKSSYLKRENVYFCPNGIPSSGVSNRLSTNQNRPVRFLFLSNMIKEKGVYVLLNACRILKQRNYQFYCDFVGDWKDISKHEFNAIRSEFGIEEEVTAYGAKYGSEKTIFFEQADVFVFPTYYHAETFGLVLLEAMDYSLPCISTDIGAIPSIIEHGKTGFCIEQENVKDLVKKMIIMIEHPDERAAMGLNGKKKFEEEFKLEKFESNMVSILRKFI